MARGRIWKEKEQCHWQCYSSSTSNFWFNDKEPQSNQLVRANYQASKLLRFYILRNSCFSLHNGQSSQRRKYTRGHQAPTCWQTDKTKPNQTKQLQERQYVKGKSTPSEFEVWSWTKGIEREVERVKEKGFNQAISLIKVELPVQSIW